MNIQYLFSNDIGKNGPIQKDFGSEHCCVQATRETIPGNWRSCAGNTVYSFINSFNINNRHNIEFWISLYIILNIGVGYLKTGSTLGV